MVPFILLVDSLHLLTDRITLANLESESEFWELKIITEELNAKQINSEGMKIACNFSTTTRLYFFNQIPIYLCESVFLQILISDIRQMKKGKDGGTVG